MQIKKDTKVKVQYRPEMGTGTVLQVAEALDGYTQVDVVFEKNRPSSSFLEDCDDLISYVKNYMAVHFKIDYVNAKGDISNYYPDFIVKKLAKEVFIVETKGLEDLDVPLKIERLKQWCVDINKAQSEIKYDYVFVDEESFNKFKPKSFEELIRSFTKYKVGMVAASSSLIK